MAPGATSDTRIETQFIDSLDDIPEGWKVMTVEEAESRQSEIVASIGKWAIKKLDGGYINGEGYGGNVWYDDSVIKGWVLLVPLYDGAEDSPLFKEQSVGGGMWRIDLSNRWVSGIAAMLAVLLLVNMCVCMWRKMRQAGERKKRKYAKVAFADSEDFSEHEADAINVEKL